MTKEQALEIIWQVCASASIPLQGHAQWQTAVSTLKSIISDLEKEKASE